MKVEVGKRNDEGKKRELIAIDRGRDRDPESDHNHSPIFHQYLTGRSPLGDLAIKKGVVAPGNVAMASADI